MLLVGDQCHIFARCCHNLQSKRLSYKQVNNMGIYGIYRLGEH